MRGHQVRNLACVLSVAVMVILTGCGGGGSVMTGTPAPNGFTNSNLMGSYSFQYSGSDVNGAPLVAAGQFTASGSGTISGGAIDLNDVEDGVLLSPSTSNGSILNTSTYAVSSDGETVITLQTNSTQVPTLALQVTLTSSSHGLLSAFDSNFAGTGTIDLQNTTATLPSNVAFSVSGVDLSVGIQAGIAGNLAVSGTAINGGSVVDVVAPGLFQSPDARDITVSGSIAADASNPGRSVVTLVAAAGTLTFASYIVDSTEVNLAEIDDVAGFLVGGQGFAAAGLGNQALSGNYAFTASGEAGNKLQSFTSGGVFTASSTAITGGEIDVHSTQVFPVANLSNATYSSDATFARIDMTLTSGNGSFEYIAYPTNENSLQMIEIDNTTAFSSATAYKQSTTTAPSGAFAMDVGGIAFTKSKIALFQTAVGQIMASGTGITGLLQINNFQEARFLQNAALSGSTISSTDTFGRGSNLTIAGSGFTGYTFAYYTVDGSRVLTNEIDNTRLGTGELFAQTTP